MDAIAEASAKDLMRRLRLAGDQHPDLRCLVHHNLGELSLGSAIDEFGDIFHVCSFRPLNDSVDFWNYFFYHESERDELGVLKRKYTDRGAFDRTAAEKRSVRVLYSKLKALFEDCIWLASDIGLSTIPGLPEFDPKDLFRSDNSWVWLLYHAAWSCPKGTILRASRWYPVRRMALAEMRKKDEEAVGFPNGPKKMTDWALVENAVNERRRSMSRKDREAEYIPIYEEHHRHAEERLAAGKYMSIMPLDPFTASAALFELMLSGGTYQASAATSRARESIANENWCFPMPKAEMARRLTGRRSARAREVEPILAQYGLRLVNGRKWTVRLDAMDATMRSKFEAVSNG